MDEDRIKKKRSLKRFLSIYKNSKRIDSGVRTLSPTIRSKKLWLSRVQRVGED